MQDAGVGVGENAAAVRGRRRSACMDAAIQPRDGCAAAMRNQPGRLSARRPGSTPYSLRRCPDFRTRSLGEQCSTPRPAHAAGRRLSLRGGPSGERGSILPVRPLGGCSESRARSYAAGPGFGGREPSRFLGTKRWKSQKLRQLSPDRTSEWKARDGVIGPPRPNCLL